MVLKRQLQDLLGFFWGGGLLNTMQNIISSQKNVLLLRRFLPHVNSLKSPTKRSSTTLYNLSLQEYSIPLWSLSL